LWTWFRLDMGKLGPDPGSLIPTLADHLIFIRMVFDLF